jgi:hypothetical protein
MWKFIKSNNKPIFLSSPNFTIYFLSAHVVEAIYFFPEWEAVDSNMLYTA